MLKTSLKNALACALMVCPTLSMADKPPVVAEQTAAKTTVAREQLATKLDSYQALAGQYTQRMTDKAGSEIQSIKGVFKLKRPGLYFWQSEEPYPQTIVSNGQKVWLYDPDLEQVTITETEQLGFNPSSFLAGDIRQELSHYQVVAEGERFSLTPVAEDAPFDALYLVFGGDVLQQASYTDKLGQTTSLTFTDVTKNPTLADTLFEFEVPAGTDIVIND